MRRWKQLLSPGHRPWLDEALVLVRVFVGGTMAFAHGLGKVSDIQAFTAGVARRGFPLPELLGPAAALSEFAGGLLLALGLLTRPAATMVLVTMTVAAFGVHGDDPFQKKELALVYAAVALLFLVAGPGRHSLDAKLFRGRAPGSS